MHKVSDTQTKNPNVGLARALSKLGYCSRAQAAAIIRAGRVHVNGALRRNAESPVRLGRDRIEVDCRTVNAQTNIYLLLNKPRGVVTTASDEKGRDTVYTCLGKNIPWVAPVGRLDKASEGLLPLTNDSAWGARVAAPETHLAKTYHVQVAAMITADDDSLINAMVRGMRLADGETLRAKHASVLRGGARNTWLEIVLDEGKNRHIRRMLKHAGIEVLRLVRVAIGPLMLETLTKGSYRILTPREKAALDKAMDSKSGNESAPKRMVNLPR